MRHRKKEIRDEESASWRVSSYDAEFTEPDTSSETYICVGHVWKVYIHLLCIQTVHDSKLFTLCAQSVCEYVYSMCACQHVYMNSNVCGDKRAHPRRERERSLLPSGYRRQLLFFFFSSTGFVDSWSLAVGLTHFSDLCFSPDSSMVQRGRLDSFGWCLTQQ